METKSPLSEEVAGLIADMRKHKKEILRWMFFFQITQLIAFLILLYLIK